VLKVSSGRDVHGNVFVKIKNFISCCSSQRRFWCRSTYLKPQSTAYTCLRRVLSEFTCNVTMLLVM